MLARTSRNLLRPSAPAAFSVFATGARFSTARFSTARSTPPTRPVLSGRSMPGLVAQRVQVVQRVHRRGISDTTREAIDRAVHSAPVVLFMKGTPEMPQCGFSRAAIQVLGLQGVDPDKFAAFNVLEDAELRAGVKEYSDWPTIPQLYVDHEFVGGCDILISMHQSGELAKLFEEKKVLVAGEAEAEDK